MSLEVDKLAAIEQWNSDPCGPAVDGEPGSRSYLLALVAGRRAYAPWMDELYEGARGLEVLDIGCGQGIDLFRLASAGAQAVTGVDITPRHLELAEQHLAAANVPALVVRADAEELPFETASFDVVSSNGVLHHTPDTQAAVREARRVLRPGGRAQIVLYNKRSLHYWTHQVLVRGLLLGGLLRERSMEGVLSTGVEQSSIGARPLVKVYTPRQAAELLRTAGFQDVRTRVRHLRPTDSYVARPFARWPAFLDRIGRYCGWYVIATGFAPRDHAAEQV